VTREGAPDGSELGILLREVNKKRRHMPLRDLFARIPSILQRLKPCIMTSPLAVSTYLDTPELMFDLVVFDEASQVRPHDAIPAMYRGRQLVVGGDPRQLPPTDFFMRTGEDVEETEIDNAGTAPFESLLDVCLALGMTRKPLNWHYRSRREALIAFSNRYFYEGRLVTFPSAAEGTGSAVSFHKVPNGRYKDGVNSIEARRVAELIIVHARTAPKKSLGVIAFSQVQQDRILDELEVLRRENPGTEVYFSEDCDDPFFVKNLENVQGDERDVILLAVGYGPDESGKVPMRLKPILNSDDVALAKSEIPAIYDQVITDLKFAETAFDDQQLKLLFACAHPDLTPKTQVVITLKYVANLKVEAIAKILAMSIDGVDKILLRARQKIKDEKILLADPLSVFTHRIAKNRRGAGFHMFYRVDAEAVDVGGGDPVLVSLNQRTQHVRSPDVELFEA
jgi:RNA polymerase sigma factor (sigma-70 family)